VCLTSVLIADDHVSGKHAGLVADEESEKRPAYFSAQRRLFILSGKKQGGGLHAA